MQGDIFDNFSWHSCIGIDESIKGNKKFVTRLPNTKRVRAAFIKTASDNNFLIHKTTRSLWKMSDDKESIEPLFPTDVLTEEEAQELMEGQK